MTLMKHVVDQIFFPVFNEDGEVIDTVWETVARDVEMTAEEEAEFLATLPTPVEAPAVPEPTKAQLMAEVQALLAKIEALP